MICPLSPNGISVNMFLCAQTFQASGPEPAPATTYTARFDPGVVEVIT